MHDVQLRREDPNRPETRRLLDVSDRYYAELYPTESNHLLDIEALRAPGTAFYALRIGQQLAGFGAMLIYSDYAEIKRMYVDAPFRGRHYGKAILDKLERHAYVCHVPCVRLETGIRQPAAIALYRSSGYYDVNAFGAYQADDLSIFMEKQLSARLAG